MIDQAIRHYAYADFLFYLEEPRGAEHRLIERHLLACNSCRGMLARIIKERI